MTFSRTRGPKERHGENSAQKFCREVRRAGTLMSHFLLSHPITCLTSRMIAGADGSALIPSRRLPERLAPTNLGAAGVTVDLAAIAGGADHDDRLAAGAEKETGGV